MAGKYYTYKNVNGNVTEDSGEFENDISFGDIVDSMFNSTFDFFNKSPLVIDYNKKSPARFIKSESSSAFPPHSKWITPKDKVLHYQVGLCGISEKDVKIDVDDNKLIITIKKDTEIDERVYSYKGLKLPTDEILELKFDPKFYNVNTIDVSLENGLLNITMQPREELKPVKKDSIFGKLKIEDNSSKAIEDKTDNNEEKSE